MQCRECGSAAVTKRPERTAGQKVTDEGDGGTQLVAYLATEKFV